MQRALIRRTIATFRPRILVLVIATAFLTTNSDSLQGQQPASDFLSVVGDSPADMEAGRRAGVQTCAVSYGYGDLVAMAKFSPAFWIDHPSELI